VGGGDDPDIHLDESVAADAADLALLENPQELRLKGEGDVPHLIEEHGPPVGLLEQSSPRGQGTGEGPLFVAKEFALQEMLGQRGAVHRDKGAGRPRTVGMDAPGDELLAGSTLADNEDVRLAGRHLLDDVKDLQHGAAPAHDILEPVGLGELRPQTAIFFQQPSLGQGPLERNTELIGAEGLRDVVKGPLFHRLYRRLYRRKGSEEDDQGLGIDASNLPEDGKAIHPGHAQVRQGEHRVLVFEPRDPLLWNRFQERLVSQPAEDPAAVL